ncbi:MAG: uroporphyrinogen decarboxylase family protein, partial [Sphaerochaetaceae bacterium]
FTQTNHPLKGVDDFDKTTFSKKLNEVIWNVVADPIWRLKEASNFKEDLRVKATDVRAKNKYAQIIGVGGNFFEMGQFLYRSDEFFIKLALEPKQMEYLLDMLLEIHLETVDFLIDSVGDVVDIFQFGDDFGTQTNTMISREMYKKFFFPRQKKLFQRVHDKSNAKVFLHSCGAVYDFLGDFIDAGVDIINPVQIGAMGMESAKLKNDFGKDIVFWGGGIDTQHVLATGSPQKVHDEVLRNCEILMKDGGFVFNQVHNIVDGVPPENVIAMYEAANSIKY